MARQRPSVASAHADWLRLIETSGPFLSLPVLVETFSHGLDAVESDAKQRLRGAYEEWIGGSSGTSTHNNWVRVIVRDLLEHDARYITSFDDSASVPAELRHRVDEHAETLWPQLVIHESQGADAEHSRLLVCVFPQGQRLDKTVASSRWAASPQSRMAELCRATGVRLGLVTNGEQWCLVDAPKDETVGYATWYAQLWLDEPDTFAAFCSLLGQHRSFAVGKDETLEALLTKSRENQHEVTDQLGLQVRRAVEMLVRTMDRADQDLGGELLTELKVGEIYEAAVTVMMRLVFLFSAEERGLLLLGDPLFDQYYAVSTLCEQLREVADQHGEEILERRRDAWCRLLAAFRAVHSGVQHDRLQIPAYGGGLFDPDRFPFLEGRQKGTTWHDSTANPLPVDNRTVLHCLESLQFLQTKIGQHVETRRLSFRALDIEQIGHVYEGLLDHTAVRASGPTLGLYGKEGDEPEIELAELEALASKNKDKLVEHLTKLKVKSSKKSVQKLIDSEVNAARIDRLRQACGSDELWNRVRPFAPLIRDDDFDRPIVMLTGQLFVTAGLDRRSTGTHYTPRSLTEPIVEHTLEPLVYEGPAEGKPRKEWKLKGPKEILDLKVCDMACGSGAFLVQACRYLGDRLVESWAIAETQAAAPNPGKLTFSTISYDGSPAKADRNLVPKDPDERLLTALRLIAQRCLYGVDINPLAVEMAKLSLWLLSLSKDKPFSFLDHAIRNGDSLLGIHDIRQLKCFSLEPNSEIQATFAGLPIADLIAQASATRLQIEELDSDTIGHVQAQSRLLGEANARIDRLRFAANMLISGYLKPSSGATERKYRLNHAAAETGQMLLSSTPEELAELSVRTLHGKHPFHWCLEFPEIISRGGFDAVIGNPPYLGSMRIAPALGDDVLTYIKTVWCHRRGNADLVVYFLLRTRDLISSKAAVGLVLNKAVAEGKSREIGLAWMVESGYAIYHAISKRPWPGSAGATITVVHLWKGAYSGIRTLDGKPCMAISSYLDNRESAEPFKLQSSRAVISQGTVLLGDAFKIAPDTAAELIVHDSRYQDYLFPFLNGSDLNTHPEHAASSWVICFDSLDEDEASTFPFAMEQIRTEVKPQRDRLSRQIHEEAYWKHWDKRDAAYQELRSSSDKAIVIPIVSKYLNAAVVPSSWMFSNKLAFLRVFDWAYFGAIQSAVFEAWALRFISSLGTTLSFSIGGCFATWPMPPIDQSMGQIAREYHSYRALVMRTRGEGLTAIYNRLHSSGDSSRDIERLREMQIALDKAACCAYGWVDLVSHLEHGYYECAQGTRFTTHHDAGAEIVVRLLALNHERYAEEVAAGLHDKKSGKKKAAKTRAASKSSATSPKGGLFRENSP